MRIAVDVQTNDFDLAAESAWVRLGGKDTGAIASFVGLVRDFSEQPDVQAMYLEHYPGMTERSLQRIAEEAARRWKLLAVRIIHRVGHLHPGDQIVLVMAGSSHRRDAFAACEFIMDFLKVQAPFWKKEVTSAGERWVHERNTDIDAAGRWQAEP